jgi:hypothetical protein
MILEMKCFCLLGIFVLSVAGFLGAPVLFRYAMLLMNLRE